MPSGTEMKYAYRVACTSRGRLPVAHLVKERGYSAMLKNTRSGTA